MTHSPEIKKIVVGYDFSSFALVALEQALQLANAIDAEVVLAHVAHFEGAHKGMPIPNGEAQFSSMLESLPAEVGAEFTAVCERYPAVKLSKALVDGHADSGIATCAEEMGAGLVVVGTHGHTGFRRLMLGSVAEKVVRIVDGNVMVARQGADPESGYRRILVPTDFSDTARRSLDFATTLASESTQIDVLHCWQMPYMSTAVWAAAPVTVAVSDNMRNETRAAIIETGEKFVAEQQAKHPGKIAYHHDECPAVQGILNRLDAESYDLVVMGSHGRRGLRRFLVGSVAEATVRHAPCSVVVVHATTD